MAKAKVTGDLYEVTCEGQYYALINGQKSIKTYEMKFKADDHAKKAGFLSAFRNALIQKDGTDSILLKKMRAKYPDYKRFRTHMIVEVINLSKKGQPVRELNLMNRPQVINFIDKKGYPIDCDLYPTVSELRQALKDYRESPETFDKWQEKRRKSRGPALAVIRSLEELNADDFDETATDAPATPPTATQPKTKRSATSRATVDPKKVEKAYAEDEPVQEDLIELSDDPLFEEDDFDPEGIQDFDDEDELNALLQGV
jgi:hypothetical protein